MMAGGASACMGVERPDSSLNTDTKDIGDAKREVEPALPGLTVLLVFIDAASLGIDACGEATTDEIYPFLLDGLEDGGLMGDDEDNLGPGVAGN